MGTKSLIQSTLRALGIGAGIAAAAYGTYAGITWYRYGRVPEPDPDERDEWLDRFMPVYEVAERHHMRVAAAADVTLEAAKEQDLLQSALIWAIFKAREAALGASADAREQPRGLLALTQSLGWGVLADVPRHEIVMGAVTKPWEANVTFRALPPEEFAAFSEPGFVKIVWTLRADAIDEGTSVFRTETRALATDATARVLFRRYWAFASPGIALIRRLSLRPLQEDAERRAQAARAGVDAEVHQWRRPCVSMPRRVVS